jgi:uncharacterized membrane protein YjgN (DUF898 family)
METTESNAIRYQFEFTGSGREYFGIWIVNLLLTIVTLGVYSAWAKVRSNRYLYGNTRVAGSAFDYTADPIQILKGRAIAVLLFVIYQVSIRFFPSFSSIALAAFFILVPAIYVFSMAFKMRYSSWRGINFSFRRDFWGAYKLFSPIFFYLLISALIPLLLGLGSEDFAINQDGAEVSPEMGIYIGSSLALALLMMLLFPLWQRKYYDFIGDRVSLGQSKLGINLRTKTFYGFYSKSAVLGLFGIMIAAVAIGFIAALITDDEASLSLAILAIYPAVLLPYLLAYAYIQTRLTNTIYSSITLGPVSFESTLAYKRMVWLYLSNTLAIVFTLGLAIPWAKVRVSKYRAECMWLLAEDLDFIRAEEKSDIDAKADAFSDVFNLDIGL